MWLDILLVIQAGYITEHLSSFLCSVLLGLTLTHFSWIYLSTLCARSSIRILSGTKVDTFVPLIFPQQFCCICPYYVSTRILSGTYFVFVFWTPICGHSNFVGYIGSFFVSWLHTSHKCDHTNFVGYIGSVLLDIKLSFS